ncbi:MAG: YceD family protein [Acidimicrobiales bacterium]
MASPFVFSVIELVKHPGTRRPTVAVGVIDGIVLSSARVVAGSELRFDGVLESIVGGSITATGAVRASWVGECRRCLQDVTGSLAADVHEVFSGAVPGGDAYPLEHERVDLEPMARDAVLLALPLAPLCDGACAGPDPQGHPVEVEAGDQGTETTEAATDTRWSALSELRFD